MYKFIIFVGCVVIVCGLEGQTTETGEGPTPQPRLSDPEVFDRPIDRSMVFIYNMVKHFLEKALNPKSLKTLVDELGFDISNMNEVYKSLTDKSSTWIAHYSSVVACVVIGIILAVAMVIVGLVFCLCRCCGKCGAKTDSMDGRFAWCQRFCLNMLLGLMVTVTLIGVVAAFISNQLVYEQTRESGLPSTLTQTLTHIDIYKDSTVHSLGMVILGKVDDSKEKFFLQIDAVPEAVKVLLGNETGAGNALERFVNFGTKLTQLENHLKTMNIVPKQIEILSPQLAGNLSRLNDTIGADLEIYCLDLDIDKDLCNVSMILLNELKVDINFTNVDNVSDVLNLVTLTNAGFHLFGNITAIALTMKANFDTISKTINDTISASLSNVKTKTNEIQARITDFVNQTSIKILEVNLEPARKFVNTEIKPPVVEYGRYVWIGALVLCSMLLLIVILYFVALLFGSCGERNVDNIESRFCNRGNGACSLVTGAVFTFLFWWIIMLITGVLFLVGGLTHTELCRHLVDPVDTASVSVLNDIVKKNLNTTLNFTDIMNNCKENQGLYTAANIEVSFPELNITKYLDLKQYGVESIIDQIKSIHINIGTIEIVNSKVYNFTNLLSSPLESINFESYHHALRSQIIIGNLEYLRLSLENLGHSMNNSAGQKFIHHSWEVGNLSSGLVAEALILKASLSTAVNSAQKIISDAQLSSLYMNLKNAQDYVNADGNRIVGGLINQTADGMFVTLQNLVDDIGNSVRTNIGQCRPLYDGVMLSVSGVCQKFLYPLNAYWFTLGWCLFLFVPCIIIALFLSNLYKKTEKYEKSEEDELLSPQNQRIPQEGVRNQAFEEDQETNMADYDKRYQEPQRGASPPKTRGMKQKSGNRRQLPEARSRPEENTKF